MKELISKELLEYKNNKSLFVSLLTLTFFLQLIVTIIFNLTQLCSHMGFDTSWSYLKAMLIWREKAVVSDIWVDTTAHLLDGSIVPASVLYGITGNIYLSYGLSNSVFVLILILIMWDVCKNFGLDLKGRLVTLNLMMCPFLYNGFSPRNLGYFMVLLCGDCLYNVRTILFLISLDVILIMVNGKAKDSELKIRILVAVSFLLAFVCGLSSGIYLLISCFIPLMLYSVIRAIVNNNAKILYGREMTYSFAGGICVFLGKLFQSVFMPLSTAGNERTWTTISDIWKNTGAVFQGFMKLLNVLPATRTVTVFSAEGMLKILSLGTALLLLLALLWALNRCRHCFNEKKFDEPVFIPVVVIIWHIIAFSLFNVQYGSAVFEERYLLCAFLSIMLLVGFCISNADREQLFSKLLAWGLVFAIIFTDLASDGIYMMLTNKEWNMDELKKMADESGAGLVLFCGDDLIETGRAMRVYDYGRFYKCLNSDGNIVHWGDYTYYDDLSFYDGRIMYVVGRDDPGLPDGILKGAFYYGTCKQYDIYISEN